MNCVIRVKEFPTNVKHSDVILKKKIILKTVQYVILKVLYNVLVALKILQIQFFVIVVQNCLVQQVVVLLYHLDLLDFTF